MLNLGWQHMERGEAGFSVASESDGGQIADLKLKHEENCRLLACADGPSSPRFPRRGGGNSTWALPKLIDVTRSYGNQPFQPLRGFRRQGISPS